MFILIFMARKCAIKETTESYAQGTRTWCSVIGQIHTCALRKSYMLIFLWKAVHERCRDNQMSTFKILKRGSRKVCVKLRLVWVRLKDMSRLYFMYDSFLIYESWNFTHMLFQLGLDVKLPLCSCGSTSKNNKTITWQDMNCASSYALKCYFLLNTVSVDLLA